MKFGAIMPPPEAQESEPARYLAPRLGVVAIGGKQHWLWWAVDQYGR
jgi:hypothetical protein